MKYSNTKLGKYKYLIQNEQLKPYLPETYLATKENIRLILETNKSVFLKPNLGTGGYGIYKISKLDEGYLLQSGYKSQKFTSLGKVCDSLLKVFSKKKYLAQKGISLLKSKNRPFDVRVMVQKNSTNHWEVTGVVGRLARPKKIVTNYHSGGTPLPLEGLLSSHLQSNKKSYMNEIRDLGVHVSNHMGKYYSKYRSFGVDVAIDSALKPWILEVNTRPDKYIFNALKDKSMFKKILRYGRRKRKG